MDAQRGFAEALEKALFREEFPFGPISRRGVLAMGLLALAACTPVVRRKGVPYVRQPEWVVEGGRAEFVTAFPHAGFAEAVRVKVYQERPLFLAPLEGAMGPYPLASLYALYDPARRGRTPDWEGFYAAWRRALAEGETLLVLPRTTSPRLEGLLQKAQARFPNLRVARFEAWSLENVYLGAEILLGRRAWPVYAPEKAETVLLLDVDLHEHPAGHLWGQALSQRRLPPMNRLYAVESGSGLLGSLADHRLALKPSGVEAFLLDLARALGVLPGTPAGEYGGFLPALAEDLGRGGLVLPGVHLSPGAQALALAVNLALGAPLRLVEPPEGEAATPRAFLEAEGAERLVWAAEGPLPELKGKAFAASLSLYPREAPWSLPLAHPLEASGQHRDALGRLWTAQALVQPLWGGRSLEEVVAGLVGEELPALAPEEKRALAEGRPLEEARPLALAPRPGWAGRLPPLRLEAPLELTLRPDYSLYDGRYRENPYLQELPRPLTRLVWDGALLLGEEEAEALGVLGAIRERERRADPRRPLLRVQAGGREALLPLWPLPGMPRGSLVAPLSHFFHPQGVALAAQVAPTGREYPLVSTQYHGYLGEVEAVKVLKEAEALKGEPKEEKRLSFYPPWPQGEHAWAMTVDLSRCLGCGLCVLACQVENNIPVVGKEEVRKGREMHWIRIDRYFTPEGVLHQPVMCQHCEKAPCEAVCPVAATEHSDEGLNLMVYNRCVGTKYCSANCPYKARRFNFFPYAEAFVGKGDPRKAKESPLALLMNPEVTVRSRGVMEKCTYCVQRIELARAQAAQEGRKLRTGEVRTACQEVCPGRAIHFGDLLDPEDPIQAHRREGRHYTLLEEANTWPRTTYLAHLKNPHPRLAKEAKEVKEEGHG
ncbi:4Fe-4S dicluster domain-containing protein [Thermus sp.]|uniref:4Fe-4S dicluster domain-containing protein n=1 Tax=Thermus sp. TaxID=275 RepID=UPI00261D7682|nr:4Fe-4S dicluster domain-containing protein [Thermus sp.]MCX7849642.1 4Fe-4S dicluster domain-containing protein [Thermus sp.]MDW8356570.1 4Fe-4S dicluster domain-containing protein [Thermus sp.]